MRPMSHHAIDFFASLGRDPGPLVCQSFPFVVDEDSPPLSGREVWNEAITEIILVGPDDVIDEEDTWLFLPETIGGAPIDPPHIAFRKRKHAPRQDHITQIKFVSNPDAAGDGFEVIRNTFSKKATGHMKGLGFLAFRRSSRDSMAYVDGEPLLFDICVCKKTLKEEIPDKYVTVERDISMTMALTMSSDLQFATRTLPAMGLCNLGYKPATVDRYPRKNQKGLELPEEALPVFAFPRHLRLQVKPLNEYPLPVYYTFVFTDENGHHLYAACLTFFEKVELSDLANVSQDLWGDNVDFELPDDKGIFCPKVVCFLSTVPFYRAMRRYLRHLYSISLSASVCPLEHFISSVVAQVPLPVEGGRPFHVVLDAALISLTSRPLAPVNFELPPARFFPMMDLDFAGPMRCLSLDTMLAVFLLMLRESKLLFISCSNTMLTETMETLRALLFPLTWSSTFVSRLPYSLTGLLQAPGGFMLGLHLDPAEVFHHPGRPRPTTTEEINAEVRKYVQTMHFDYPMVQGTYVVDLSSSSIYQFNGKHLELLNASHVESILRTVPNGPKLRLRDKLRHIAEEYAIAPQVGGLEEFDSAFDFQHNSINSDELDGPKKKWDDFPTLDIRDAFMSFVADILGDYTQYVVPPTEDLTADTYRTFKEEFAVKEYLHDADQSCRSLLEMLMETQMFAVLLQQRSEGTSHSIVFFERAAALQRTLGLSCGGHDAHSGKTTVNVCALPAPLYKLLQAEEQWSGLSKVMQHQILHHFNLNPNAAGHLKGSIAVPKLTMLSISALSPLRSNNQFGPTILHNLQPIHNQKLLDLLAYMDFTKTVPAHLLDEETSLSQYAIARQELDRDEDLHLDSAEFGPLVIPGPVLPKSAADLGEDDKPRHSYNNGWPTLQQTILEDFASILHKKIPLLRDERLFTLRQINKSVLMFIRSPQERLATESARSVSESASKSSNEPTVVIHHSLSPMVSAILDIASVSISLLAMRAVQGVRPINDVLQILGIVAQLESWGAINLLDETTWRSALIACGANGGDLLRRVAIVLKDCIIHQQIVPDAMTFGQYMKALSNKTCKANTDGCGYVDQYFFLEEIGLTWYVQKAALTHQPMTTSVCCALREKDKDCAREKELLKEKNRIAQKINSEATQLVCGKLQLQHSSAFLPFYYPPAVVSSILPQSSSTISDADAVSVVEAEMALRIEALHTAARPVELSPDEKRLLQPSFTAQQQDIPPPPPASSHAFPPFPTISSPAKSIDAAGSKSSQSPMNMMSRLTMMGSSMMRAGASASSSVSAAVSHKSEPSSPMPGPSTSSWGMLKAAFGGAPSSSSSSSPVPSHSQSMSVESGETSVQSTSSEVDEQASAVIEKLSSSLHFDDDDEDDDEDGEAYSNQTTSETVPSQESFDQKDSHASADVSEPLTTSESEGVLAPLTTEQPETPSIAISVLDSIKLNDDILHVIADENVNRGRALAIHSCTPCECGFSMMDEELLSAWCHGANIDVHKLQKQKWSLKQESNEVDSSQGQSDTSNSREELDFGVSCPHCGRNLEPKLQVHCLERMADAQSLNTRWSEVVTYLSPFVVRFELEELILKVGENVSQPDWLHSHSAALYWNVVWYTSRCRLPCGFLPVGIVSLQPPNSTLFRSRFFNRLEHKTLALASSEHASMLQDLSCPVVIAWQETVARAKALQVLRGKSASIVDVRDIFPAINDADEEEVRQWVIPNLDGAPASLRLSMIHLASCKSIMNSIRLAEGESNGRALYVALLMLAVHLGNYQVYDSSKTVFNRDIAKECTFHRIFVDCIRCVLSKADFEDIGTDETTLLECAKDYKTIAVRAVFGLLL